MSNFRGVGEGSGDQQIQAAGDVTAPFAKDGGPHSFTEFREKFAASLHDIGVSPVRWLANATT